jgi:hypothetical protein
VRIVREHPLTAFFLLAFAVAWVFLPFRSFGAFGPLVAALVVIPICQGRAGLRRLGSRLIRWRVPWYCWVLAFGVPLAATMILAAVVTSWHVPLLFLEPGGTEPSFVVSFLVTTVAVTFWYA